MWNFLEKEIFNDKMLEDCAPCSGGQLAFLLDPEHQGEGGSLQSVVPVLDTVGCSKEHVAANL